VHIGVVISERKPPLTLAHQPIDRCKGRVLRVMVDDVESDCGGLVEGGGAEGEACGEGEGHAGDLRDEAGPSAVVVGLLLCLCLRLWVWV
jgi:hypothetical protein